jgi:hypothetical protein
MEAVSFQASITGFNATSPNQYRQYLQNGAGPLLNGSGYDKVGDYVEQAMLKYLK